MVRRAATALIALLLAAAAPPAPAQSLQRLTVESFALSADTAHPELEVPFHLILTLRVRENVPAIDNLELPILAELELLGDERHVTATPKGTQYRETIAVVAHHTGSITISPAMLQAIDARDGKPKQYSTNSLTLDVAGGKLEPVPAGLDVGELLRAAARVLGWILGIACAIAIAVVLIRRRPRVVAPAPAPPAAPSPLPPPRRSNRDRLNDALTVLRAAPSRESAVRVRGAIWSMVGASDGETLADVLQRPAAAEPRLRDVLRALERAAFTYDDDLTRAIANACDALERALA